MDEIFEKESDCLIGTVWDYEFGSRSPLRHKPNDIDVKEWINCWIESDDVLREWLEKGQRTYSDAFSRMMEETPCYAFKKYFLKKESKFEGIEKWDNLDKKYDIPKIALGLRGWDEGLGVKYQIEIGNLEWLKRRNH